MLIIAVFGTDAMALATIALTVVLVRFNRKRSTIIRAAASISPRQLDTIYTLLERTGTVSATGYVLARTNRRIPEERCLIPVPMAMRDFPWAGKVIQVVATDKVIFYMVETMASEPACLGNVYRPVQVPRHQTKQSSKPRNAFVPKKISIQ